MSSFIFFGSGACIVDGIDIHGGYIRVMLMVLMTFFSPGVGEAGKEKHANASGGVALPCDPDIENKRYNTNTLMESGKPA